MREAIFLDPFCHILFISVGHDIRQPQADKVPGKLPGVAVDGFQAKPGGNLERVQLVDERRVACARRVNDIEYFRVIGRGRYPLQKFLLIGTAPVLAHPFRVDIGQENKQRGAEGNGRPDNRCARANILAGEAGGDNGHREAQPQKEARHGPDRFGHGDQMVDNAPQGHAVAAKPDNQQQAEQDRGKYRVREENPVFVLVCGGVRGGAGPFVVYRPEDRKQRQEKDGIPHDHFPVIPPVRKPQRPGDPPEHPVAPGNIDQVHKLRQKGGAERIGISGRGVQDRQVNPYKRDIKDNQKRKITGNILPDVPDFSFEVRKHGRVMPLKQGQVYKKKHQAEHAGKIGNVPGIVCDQHKPRDKGKGVKIPLSSVIKVFCKSHEKDQQKRQHAHGAKLCMTEMPRVGIGEGESQSPSQRPSGMDMEPAPEQVKHGGRAQGVDGNEGPFISHKHIHPQQPQQGMHDPVAEEQVRIAEYILHRIEHRYFRKLLPAGKEIPPVLGQEGGQPPVPPVANKGVVPGPEDIPEKEPFAEYQNSKSGNSRRHSPVPIGSVFFISHKSS